MEQPVFITMDNLVVSMVSHLIEPAIDVNQQTLKLKIHVILLSTLMGSVV